MLNITVIAYSIMAAIIGAGFASGQEILVYFVSFGRYGMVGISVSIAVFMIFIYAVMSACIKYGFDNYDDFLSVFDSKTAKTIVKTITVIFSFSVYGAMLSAAGELLFFQFALDRALGTLLCSVLAVVLFLAAGDKVFVLNGFLGIILVLLIAICGLYMLSYREFHVFFQNAANSAADGFVYSGYNLISLTPVLVTLAKKIKKPSDAVCISVCTGCASAVLMTMIFILISIYAGKIPLGELPLMTLARRQSSGFSVLYALVLLCAIITTLISSGGGLFNALGIKENPLGIAGLTISAYAFSGMGFSRIIDTAYRICGIAGILVCILTVFAIIRKRK